jgi:hypothetical protein
MTQDTQKIDEAEMKSLIESYERLGGRINKFIQYVESNWRSGLASE